MSRLDTVQEKRELTAAVTIAPDRIPTIIQRARADAAALALDVRDLDPHRVWGRMNLWRTEDPERLLACCWLLAAMVPVEDMTEQQLLAWVTRPARQRKAA